MDKEMLSYLRGLGLTDKEIRLLVPSNYGDAAGLKAAIDAAIRNALASHLAPEDEDSDTYEMEDDEGDEGDDTENYDEQLVGEVAYLAECDGLDLDELRRQAKCGNVAKEKEAAAKLHELYRAADRYLSE